MDKFREAENNPFDAPVPGQSFTDKPGNYPWEHSPQYTDTAEAADYVWDRLSQPEFAEQVIAMLDAGIPVEAIGRIIIFAGFTEGKWTPDVAFIIAEPVMKMIATIGVIAEVPNINISMDDMTNKQEVRSAVKIQAEAKKVGKGVAEEIKQKGIMAKPGEVE